MPNIKVNHVLSCSSEDPVHKAENMLVSDHYRKWKSAQPGEKQISLVLQLEKSSVIHSIDIGNEGSAFVEILVGRSSDPQQNFQVLLVTSSFMTPIESRQAVATNRVRMFGSDKLSQTVSKSNWDLVKVVCTLPFNKSLQYGLSFIVFHSPPEKHESENKPELKQTSLGSFKLKAPEESESQVSVGSWFAKRKSNSQEVDPLTGPAAIRSSASDSKAEDTDSNPIMAKKIRKIIKESSSPDREEEERTPKTCSLGNSLLKESMKLSGSKADPPIKKNNDVNSSLKISENGKTSNPSSKKSENPFKQHRNGNITQTPSHSKISSKQTPPNRTEVKEVSHTGAKQATTTHRKDKPKIQKNNPSKQFHKILDHVVFVLSGYQNPQRGQIRDKAIEMGAVYKPDWDKDCTHLICAFANTPKFHQVQKKHGKIVKETWIIECFKQRKLLPWKHFRLGKDNRSDSSDSEGSDNSDHSEPKVVGTVTKYSFSTNKQITSSSSVNKQSTSSPSVNKPSTRSPSVNKPSTSKNNSFNSSSASAKTEPDELDSDEIYAAVTDVESDSGCDTDTEIARVESNKNYESTPKIDTSNLPLPPLPDMFEGTRFLFFGDIPQREKKNLVRYITGCSGIILQYMSKEVKYVLTYSKWIQDFTDALRENKAIRIVHPNWIIECIEQGCLVPPSDFFVSKHGK